MLFAETGLKFSSVVIIYSIIGLFEKNDAIHRQRKTSRVLSDLDATEWDLIILYYTFK